jgi:DnaJ-class molecular chaperone
MDEDYYKTLNIARGASEAEIQKAYREMARKYHPDLNPDDKSAKEKFQQVQRAFEVLNDPKKREMYDRYGSAFESGAGASRPGPQGSTYRWSAGPEGATSYEDLDLGQFFREGSAGGNAGGGGFGDFFRQFTRSAGGPAASGRGAQARRGEDVHHEATIPFQTAIEGGEVELRVGQKNGAVETLSIKIPPGMENGKKIRLRGQGEPASRRGAAGDLLLTIRVAPHPFFTRRGNHLELKTPITLAEAALGAKIDVPSPKGTVTVKVPPGTSSGAKLRLKGCGAAPKSGPAGDLFVEIEIVLPAAIDDESAKLVRQFAERNPQAPRGDLRW